MSSIQSIRELTEPLLAEAGLALWDVEMTRGVVRILVEREGGVDLDALTRASQALSGLLDQHPEVAPDGSYQLEVSSPGVERTLRTAEQYRRFLGEPVNIRLTGPIGGQRRWRGTLVAASDEDVTISPEEASAPKEASSPDGEVPAGTVSFRYEQIERTRTVLVWGSPAGPSGGKGRNSKKAGGSAHRPDPRRQSRASQTAGPGVDRRGVAAGSARPGTELKETS